MWFLNRILHTHFHTPCNRRNKKKKKLIPNQDKSFSCWPSNNLLFVAGYKVFNMIEWDLFHDLIWGEETNFMQQWILLTMVSCWLQLNHVGVIVAWQFSMCYKQKEMMLLVSTDKAQHSQQQHLRTVSSRYEFTAMCRSSRNFAHPWSSFLCIPDLALPVSLL